MCTVRPETGYSTTHFLNLFEHKPSLSRADRRLQAPGTTWERLFNISVSEFSFHPECQMSTGQLVLREGTSEKGWDRGKRPGITGLRCILLWITEQCQGSKFPLSKKVLHTRNFLFSEPFNSEKVIPCDVVSTASPEASKLRADEAPAWHHSFTLEFSYSKVLRVHHYISLNLHFSTRESDKHIRPHLSHWKSLTSGCPGLQTAEEPRE